MKRKKAAALKYLPGYTSPKVTAIGFGEIAERIVREADRNDVPIVENEELANSLTALSIDHDIPAELYEACAAVISYVYLIDQRKNSNSDLLRRE